MTGEPLAAAYGFGELAIAERLSGGFANDLHRVEADGRALVLRIVLPPADEADLAYEHRVMAALDVAPSPLRTPDGRTFVRCGDRLAWLMPLVDGVPADPGRAAHRTAAAQALAAVHGAGVDPGPRPRLRPLAELEWPPARDVPELGAWREVVRRERAWAVERVARIACDRSPPVGLVHGDYFPGNVLVGGDTLRAVIDWEQAQPDWLTWDLACAVGEFCAAGDGVDAAAMAAFVGAYRAAAGPAPRRDDDLLLPLLRVKRVLEVLRAPTDRDPMWPHQRRNLRSLAHLPR